MKAPTHHLFLCGSIRANGEPNGVCKNKDSLALLSYLQSEVKDRMLDGVEVAMTGCMNMCAHGPILIDYPAGPVFGKVTESKIDDILDAIEEGEVATQHLIS